MFSVIYPAFIAIWPEKKRETFILITVTSSATLICFQQKYRKRLQIGEYTLHQ